MTDLKPVEVAVVGAGHWGPHLVRNFDEHALTRVRYIVERDRDRWATISNRFEDIEVTDDWKRILADDALDAVVIATPTVTHFELARAALESGKHVMVEKPLTNSSESAESLVRLAADRERILFVGHVFLFNSGVRYVKTLIDDASLGDVFYVSMNRTNLGPVRLDVSAAWDLAAHDISIAGYWLDSEPTHVSATGGSWLNPDIQDTVFVTARYPDEVLVHIEASWLNPRKNRLISVIGNEKMVTLDDVNLVEPIRIYDKCVVDGGGLEDTFDGFRSQIREGAVTIPRVAMGEPLKVECDAFVQRIFGAGDSIADGENGLAVVRVLEAIDRSIKQGGGEITVATS